MKLRAQHKSSAYLAPLLLVSSALPTLAETTLRPNDRFPTICKRFGQASTIHKQTLYYTGGWLSSDRGNSIEGQTKATSLAAIDISGPWSVKNLEIVEIPSDGTTKAWSVDSFLFAGNDTLREYALQDGLYTSFTTSVDGGDGWDKEKAEMKGFRGDEASWGMEMPARYAAAVQADGYGYTVGGESATGKILEDIIQYDLASGGVKALGQMSTATMKGGLAFLPVGEKGALISIGGMKSVVDAVSAHTVGVFDIANQRWFDQPTTGEVPENIQSVTAFVAAAQDGSSYSIHITYTAGYNSGLAILSVPSFIWTTNIGKTGAAPPVRERPSVDVVSGSQAILYGGEIQNDCDIQPLYIFDMNTLKWASDYQGPDTRYTIPSVITKKIGGSGTGGATIREPHDANWENEKLAEVFATSPAKKTDAKPTTASTDKLSTESNTPPKTTEAPEEDSGKGSLMDRNTIIIITCLLGSSLIVTCITIMILLMRRRRRRGGYSRSRGERPESQEILVQNYGRMELSADTVVILEAPAAEIAQMPPARKKTVKVTDVVCEAPGDEGWKRRSIAAVKRMASRRRAGSTASRSRVEMKEIRRDRDDEAQPPPPPPYQQETR